MAERSEKRAKDLGISALTTVSQTELRDIAKLNIAAWGGNPTRDIVETMMRRSRTEIEETDPDKQRLFVAKSEGAMVGFVITRQEAKNPSERCWLMLMVHPDHRRQGIATALFNKTVAYVRERRGTALGSETHADNAGSIALHKALGFRNEGTFKCPYDGDEKVAFSLPFEENKHDAKTE